MSDSITLSYAMPERSRGEILDEEFLQELLDYITQIDASDIYFKSNEHAIISRYGNMQRLSARTLSATEVEEIGNIIYRGKCQSQFNTKRPVDKSYEFNSRTSRETKRFRVNMSAQRNGISITIRVINFEPPVLASVGLDASDPLVQAATNHRNGLILIVGATGSGKSTTLAAINRHLLTRPDANMYLVTFEAPIEYVYDSVLDQAPTGHVSQHEIGSHFLSFQAGVESSLRMAPTHIMVGETRDKATLSATLEESKGGHLCFTTAHANSVAATITRLLELCEPEFRDQLITDLIDNLRIIMAQRLIKTIDGKRVACREWLVFNDRVKSILYKNKSRIVEVIESIMATTAQKDEHISMAQYESQLKEQGLIA